MRANNYLRIYRKVPKEILRLIVIARRQWNFNIYIVGGFLRNLLLGHTIKDLDLATDMRPEGVERFLNFLKLKYLTTGLKYGTITFILKGIPYEITTFRKDINYDGRRPKMVSYVSNLDEDSSRRDFTFNAIYWNPFYGLLDPQKGLRDIQLRKLRFIGNYQDRILEDKIRVLRYVRFNVLYIRTNWNWAKRHLYKFNLSNLSSDRIDQELRGLLLKDFKWHHYRCLGILPQLLSNKWFGDQISKDRLSKFYKINNLLPFLPVNLKYLLRLYSLFGENLTRFRKKLGSSANWILKLEKGVLNISTFPYLKDYWRILFIHNEKLEKTFLSLVRFFILNKSNDTLLKGLRLGQILLKCPKKVKVCSKVFQGVLSEKIRFIRETYVRKVLIPTKGNIMKLLIKCETRIE